MSRIKETKLSGNNERVTQKGNCVESTPQTHTQHTHTHTQHTTHDRTKNTNIHHTQYTQQEIQTYTPHTHTHSDRL